MKLADGQTALVTGASRGLGVEIARSLAARGLDLVLVARSADALQQVAAELRVSGRTVRTLTADLGSAASVQDLADRVNGLCAVDVLVNNAGVESTLRFDEREPVEIADTVAVNLTGPMLLTRALLPGMLARGRGHIVNIASVAGVLAVPFNEPYSATKFGLVGLTRALRMTAQASGWTVSASVVCPGFIDGAGLFEELKRKYGVSPDGLGACPVEAIGPAVIEAIEMNLPDVIVAEGDIRGMAAMAATNPAEFEAAALNAPATAMFRSVAAARAAWPAKPADLEGAA
ncbi:MAG: SDR family NAD(P)-dependent oxidoreductase [Caulobacterales bacterium]|nr:SDR family NAD(P)-dependent oxidoreductase [Caulobacterales bacterium]